MPDYYASFPVAWWNTNVGPLADGAKVTIGNGVEVHRADGPLPENIATALGSYKLLRCSDPADFTAAAAPTFSMPVSDLQEHVASNTTHSRTFDLSALASGDKVIVMIGYDANYGTAPTLTVQGQSATRLNSTNPTQSGSRNTAIFEVTLSSAGSASATVQSTTSNLFVGNVTFAVFGFKGAGTVVQNIGSYFSETSFTRSVTPTSATNFIIAHNFRSGTPASFAWTNVTGIEEVGSHGIASAQNVPASALNVGFTKTDTSRGAIAVAAVMSL